MDFCRFASRFFFLPLILVQAHAADQTPPTKPALTLIQRSPAPYQRILEKMLNPKKKLRGVNEFFFAKYADIDANLFTQSHYREVLFSWQNLIPFWGSYRMANAEATEKISAAVDTAALTSKLEEGKTFRLRFLRQKLMEARQKDPALDSLLHQSEVLFRMPQRRRTQVFSKEVPEAIAEYRAKEKFRAQNQGRYPDPKDHMDSQLYRRMLGKEKLQEENSRRSYLEDKPLDLPNFIDRTEILIEQAETALQNLPLEKEFYGLRSHRLSLELKGWPKAVAHVTLSGLAAELRSLVTDLKTAHAPLGSLERIKSAKRALVEPGMGIRVPDEQLLEQLYEVSKYETQTLRPFVEAHWWGFAQGPRHWTRKNAFLKRLKSKTGLTMLHYGASALHGAMSLAMLVAPFSGFGLKDHIDSYSKQFQYEKASGAHNKPAPKDGSDKKFIYELKNAPNDLPQNFDLIAGTRAAEVMRAHEPLLLPTHSSKDTDFYLYNFSGDDGQKPTRAGTISIPSPEGYSLKTLDVFTHSVWKNYSVALDPGKDYSVYRDPTNGDYFIKLLRSDWPTTRYALGHVVFEKEPTEKVTEQETPAPESERTALEKTIFELSHTKLSNYVEGLRSAGFTEFSQHLARLIEKDRGKGQRHSELSDFIELFASTAQYQRDGREGDATWFPDTVFEEFSKFALDGKACMQCDGGNSFLSAILNDYYGADSGIEVRPVVSIPRSDKILELPLHQQSEIYVLGERVFRFDATPRNEAPESPVVPDETVPKPKFHFETLPTFEKFKRFAPEIIADRWRRRQFEVMTPRAVPTAPPPPHWKSVDERSLELEKQIDQLLGAQISHSLEALADRFDDEIITLKKLIEQSSGKEVAIMDPTAPWMRKFKLLATASRYLRGTLSKSDFMQAHRQNPETLFHNFFLSELDQIEAEVKNSLASRTLRNRFPFLQDELVQEKLRAQELSTYFQKTLRFLDDAPQSLDRLCEKLFQL